MHYRIDEDLEVKFSTKTFPFEYKLLEWRLIINRQLYEDGIIDIKIFSEMENQLIGRLKKMRTELYDKQRNLTSLKSDGIMPSS